VTSSILVLHTNRWSINFLAICSTPDIVFLREGEVGTLGGGFPTKRRLDKTLDRSLITGT